MNNLTFKYFLKKYVHDLSLDNTLYLSQLIDECQYNARLIEPLCLYIRYNYKVEQINRLKDSFIKSNVLKLLEYDDLDAELKNKKLSTEYNKVYLAYKCECNKYSREQPVKMNILKIIKNKQEEKNISNYKIYKSLNLNAGNINNFLKNGNVSKVSLSTAKEILDFVEKY